jgi:uncharacterized protein (DUF1697 family)
MLETSRVPSRSWWVLLGVLAIGCAAPAPELAQQPATPQGAAAEGSSASQATQEVKLAEEARALLAQAETDVQRARAKRALWLKAWEDLLASRQAAASKDHAKAIRRAKSASEFAQLGLEQLAYPAVK